MCWYSKIILFVLPMWLFELQDCHPVSTVCLSHSFNTLSLRNDGFCVLVYKTNEYKIFMVKVCKNYLLSKKNSRKMTENSASCLIHRCYYS